MAFSFDDITDQISQIISASQTYWPIALYILAALWIIQIINFILRYQLNLLGIYPRHLSGLPGIIFSPFLHGNFEHLIFNSIPLFILTNLILIQFGLESFILISAIIILASGLGIWIFGRTAIHVGASAVIMGYWSFLLIQIYFQPNISIILISLVCIYYLGGLWTNILPSANEQVSWEGHLIGFLAGIGCAFLLKNLSLITLLN